ncbi:hypothetical protein IWW38_001690 [Coemansia aciculifera]|uniref:Uncharacterized protein n=1 Tax=Coemansia aciculifera TaxID=417176 RepID=A0ACC1M625_9FUNG|nr:hypothetical protein IWW38_001690 [Coemansia aciculifera]
MSAPLASVVPAVAESLDALEAHQYILIERLKAIRTQLSLGEEAEDELLPTLTFYINQASYVQRKMMLIHGRVGDMKRRADRLKAHRAKQDEAVAEWMAQERALQVPAARASPALAQAESASGRGGDDELELPSPSSSLVSKVGLGIENQSAELANSRPASVAATDSDAASVPVATIKRKGKRRVRMTTIE